MHMKQQLPKKNLLPLALAAGCALSAAAVVAEETRPPNIVFIMADDLGWMDTGAYGSSFYQTPNIDRLAERGMRFTNAYSASPLCSPTRASLLTGLHPARVGITAPWGHVGNPNFEERIAAGAPPHIPELQVGSGGVNRLRHEYYTYAEALKDAGYRTAHFGKWHVGSAPFSPREQGFDIDIPHWFGPGPAGAFLAPWQWPANHEFDRGEPGEHIDDRITLEAIDFIKQHRDEPLLINMWPFLVHSPYDSKRDVKADKLENFIPRAIEMYQSGYPQHNAVMGGMVATFDKNVGRLLDAIDDLGLTDNTIIIFYSDNGGVTRPPRESYNHPEPAGTITSNYPLREGKGSVYEGGVRVPLIVSWPGVTEPGSVSDVLVVSPDFYPTFLEMTGVEAYPGLAFDGRSFVPALHGEDYDYGPLFIHFPHGSQRAWEGFQPATTVRMGDWKLLRFFADTRDQSDRLELYNLRDDIGESRNLVAEHPQKALELNALIDGFLSDTGAAVPRPNPNFSPEAAEAHFGDDWRNAARKQNPESLQQ